MEKVAIVLIAISPAVVCSVFSGMLALQGRPGWGWFLFIALLMFGSIKVSIK